MQYGHMLKKKKKAQEINTNKYWEEMYYVSFHSEKAVPEDII